MAGMIVGRLTLAWKRQNRVLTPGEGWKRVRWFDVEHHELHSTKGWRLVKRFQTEVQDAEWFRSPAYQEIFRPADGVGGLKLDKGPSEVGRLMRGRTPAACAVRMSCHDWWRREQFGSSKRLSRTEFRDAMMSKPLQSHPGPDGRVAFGGAGEDVIVAPTL